MIISRYFIIIKKAGIIIRQYYSYNLKERIASMPYLTNIEKKWISFQLIYGLKQIHNLGYCHGDIKLENILLTSTSSVFLADIATYKPAYIQQDDVGSFTYYFGTNSSVKSCYLAPERLITKYVYIYNNLGVERIGRINIQNHDSYGYIFIRGSNFRIIS